MTHNKAIAIDFDWWKPPKTKTDELSIYLLHFPNPLHGRRHYLGIAKTNRLTARWAEHAQGTGAKITRALMLKNDHFFVTMLLRNATFEMEKRIKRAGHFNIACGKCSPELNLDPYATVFRGSIQEIPKFPYDALSPVCMEFKRS